MKGILPGMWLCQGCDKLSMFLIGLFISVEEKYESLQRKPYLLEALASRTLFLQKNFVCF
jgi:hypothetical protein